MGIILLVSFGFVSYIAAIYTTAIFEYINLYYGLELESWLGISFSLRTELSI